MENKIKLREAMDLGAFGAALFAIPHAKEYKKREKREGSEKKGSLILDI